MSSESDMARGGGGGGICRDWVMETAMVRGGAPQGACQARIGSLLSVEVGSSYALLLRKGRRRCVYLNGLLSATMCECGEANQKETCTFKSQSVIGEL